MFHSPKKHGANVLKIILILIVYIILSKIFSTLEAQKEMIKQYNQLLLNYFTKL